MKQVTVIIPNYNGAKYLEDCITSLLANDRTLFDILIVDNASTDGSEDTAERMAQTQEGISLIRMSENTGFTGAVNAGIRQAATPFVLLLNNDTRADRELVASLLHAAAGNETVFSVSARMLSMQEPDKLDDAGDCYCALGWAFGRGRGKDASRYAKPGQVFAACGGAAIYRRELLEKLGGFDDSHFAYLEDIDIGYRARIHGYCNYYEPSAVVWHAGSAVSGSRHNSFKVSLSSRNSVYLVYKNMPFLQILLNSPFLLCGFLLKFLFFAGKGYGGVYAGGLAKGLRLSASRRGRERKVTFRVKHLPAYIRIQFWLWGGMFAILREF